MRWRAMTWSWGQARIPRRMNQRHLPRLRMHLRSCAGPRAADAFLLLERGFVERSVAGI